MNHPSLSWIVIEKYHNFIIPAHFGSLIHKTWVNDLHEWWILFYRGSGMIHTLMDLNIIWKDESSFFIPWYSTSSAATWPLKHSKLLNHQTISNTSTYKMYHFCWITDTIKFESLRSLQKLAVKLKLSYHCYMVQQFMVNFFLMEGAIIKCFQLNV